MIDSETVILCATGPNSDCMWFVLLYLALVIDYREAGVQFDVLQFVEQDSRASSLPANHLHEQE
jgi:hypothetical protein